MRFFWSSNGLSLSLIFILAIAQCVEAECARLNAGHSGDEDEQQVRYCSCKPPRWNEQLTVKNIKERPAASKTELMKDRNDGGEHISSNQIGAMKMEQYIGDEKKNQKHDEI